MGIKRGLDIAVAASALLLLSPLLLIVGIVVAITMGRPVIYRQRRPGRFGKDFTILKFRTMTEAKDSFGRLLPDARRKTPFGKFLRDSSIDELPQLVNVLRGQMSLVGPRPLMHQYLKDCTPDQLRRHNVRPGITGLSQVQGRKALNYDQRFALDTWYVDNWSMWQDLKIILATIVIVLRRDGTVETGKPQTTPAEKVTPIAGESVYSVPRSVFDEQDVEEPLSRRASSIGEKVG